MVIMQDDFSAIQAIGKEENGYVTVASTYKDRETVWNSLVSDSSVREKAERNKASLTQDKN